MYVVKIGDLTRTIPDAAFQEVSGLGTKVSEITLKRGVVANVSLFDAWIKGVRDKATDVRKTVVIELQGEDRARPVQSWTLRAARPIKYTGPTLSGKGGGDVAIEELVLSCEGIEIA